MTDSEQPQRRTYPCHACEVVYGQPGKMGEFCECEGVDYE